MILSGKDKKTRVFPFKKQEIIVIARIMNNDSKNIDLKGGEFL